MYDPDAPEITEEDLMETEYLRRDLDIARRACRLLFDLDANLPDHHIAVIAIAAAGRFGNEERLAALERQYGRPRPDPAGNIERRMAAEAMA